MSGCGTEGKTRLGNDVVEAFGVKLGGAFVWGENGAVRFVGFMDLWEKINCRCVRGAFNEVEIVVNRWDEEMRSWILEETGS